jgi:hypothetical protein
MKKPVIFDYRLFLFNDFNNGYGNSPNTVIPPRTT